MRRLSTWAFLLALLAGVDAAADDMMLYLDNGTIRLGVDLRLGGAITYLSPSGQDKNLVNSYDYGRQIQMSHYAGPVPYIVGDKRPKPHWEHLGWNPIQSGDDFGHGSQILEHRAKDRELYIRCRPMQWPLDNEPAECEFESWISLAGQAAHVRAKLTNHRADTTQYPARGQELPAVYTNGPYWRLMTYAGSQPFSGEALTQIVKPAGEPGPWTHWNATERWSALVDDSGWGLGVWNPDTTRWGGGFAGKPGAGGAHDSPTGYIAPLRNEILDHDIEYSYRYALILGTLDEIRGWVARQPRPAVLPEWTFDRTRAGWTYANATDAGLPIRGKLEVQLEHDDPQLVGPPTFWQAADAPIVEITADSNFDEPVKAQLFFSTLDRPGFHAERVVDFELGGRTEKPATYRVRLADAPGYRGAITQLRFDPIPRGKPGCKIDVYSIRLLGP